MAASWELFSCKKKKKKKFTSEIYKSRSHEVVILSLGADDTYISVTCC